MKARANKLSELNLKVLRDSPHFRLSFLTTRFYLMIRMAEIRAVIIVLKDLSRLEEIQGMETRQQLAGIVLVPAQLIGAKDKSLEFRATSTI